MRKYFMYKNIGICLVALLVSCDDKDCSGQFEQLGETETVVINDQTVYQARWTLFEYFDNGALSVSSSSFVQDQNCVARVSMRLALTAEPNLERQNFTVTQSSRETTNIIFRQKDEDTVLGEWLIVEGEPNWVQFDEITETSVKGRLQATLVIEETGNNFYTLPDTLRFDNVSFEAVVIPARLLHSGPY